MNIRLIAASGTTTRQRLATLAALPPSQANITLDTYPADPTDGNVNGKVANLYYQNGSIYGDVTPNSPAASPVSWFPIRVRSGGTVLAFGHVPVMASSSCGGYITPATASSAALGTEYSQTFAGAGTANGYAISMAGDVPPGLTFTSQAANGTLSGTPLVAGTYSFTIVAAPSGGSCATQQNYIVTVSGPSCVVDVTSQVAIALGGLKKNLATGQWTETVTLQNTGAAAIGSPINVVLSNLSSNATLVNSSGITQCFAQGMPYVTYPAGLAPGGAGTVTLTFTNSNPSLSITFTPRIAAGGNQI